MTKKLGQILAGCFLSLVLVAVGYKWSADLLEDYAACMKTQNWPHVSGKLIRFARGVAETSYTVDGTTYHQTYLRQNRNYYKGDISGFWRNFYREHPDNSTVEVYYNPKHPETSLLIPGIGDPWAFVISVIVAASLLLLPVLMVLAVIFELGKKKKQT